MRKLLCLFTIAIVVVNCRKEAAIQNDASLPPDSYVQNEVLVSFRQSSTEALIAHIVETIGAHVKEHVFTKAMEQLGDPGYYVITVNENVPAAIRQLKSFPEVLEAEPDYVAVTLQQEATSFNSIASTRTAVASDNPLYTQQWNLQGSNAGESYGANVTDAWALFPQGSTPGSDAVYVGVINAGINAVDAYAQEDLTANIWTNPIDPADGKDNDGNGYIDDIHGWNFNGRNNKIGGECLDWRGTRVAGIIGAADNTVGIIGISPKVTYIAAKFMTCGGGSMNDVVKAIDYFVGLKLIHGLNIVALDNSWSTTQGARPSSTLQSAIERANKAGILFVAAAADYNLNTDKSPIYPACYPNNNVIAVGSLSRSGALTVNSNWGASSIDLFAPGENILSTYNALDVYQTRTGTWEAAPHVSAACALYAAYKGFAPTDAAGAARIKNAILRSVKTYSTLNGKCSTGGFLDVQAALNQP